MIIYFLNVCSSAGYSPPLDFFVIGAQSIFNILSNVCISFQNLGLKSSLKPSKS